MLVIRSPGNGFPFRYCLQYLGVKLSHFKNGMRYWEDIVIPPEDVNVDIPLISYGRREPVLTDKALPVIEPRFAITKAAASCTAVFPPVVVMLRFSREQVVLLINKFPFLCTYGYADMCVSGITLVLYRLRAAGGPV